VRYLYTAGLIAVWVASLALTWRFAQNPARRWPARVTAFEPALRRPTETRCQEATVERQPDGSYLITRPRNDWSEP
jgi:hypothetical protein